MSLAVFASRFLRRGNAIALYIVSSFELLRKSNMSVKAFISGCESLSLSAAEAKFFAAAQPWGLILFKRNCESPDQIKALTAQFRAAVGRKDAPVFIDQEGGRVQRLGPPSNHWRIYPSASEFGKLYERCPVLAFRTVRNSGRLMAEDLYDIGITCDRQPGLCHAH
jgi:beta-N-acetylhexosaminidase